MASAPLPTNVAGVIADWPAQAKTAFAAIRAQILAADDAPLTETLKWGEPAYLPSQSGRGSTLRLAWSAKRPDEIGLFVNCKTTLAATMQDIYPDAFRYEGERALYLKLDAPLPSQAISHCATLTFNYHRTPKAK